MAENFAGPRVCMAKINEYCQKRRLKLEYREIDISGPAHDRVFTVAVVIDGRQYSTGTGKSKKEAKDRAAGPAWEIIEQEMQQGLAPRPQQPPLPALPPQPQPSQLSSGAGNMSETLPPSSVNCISMLNEYASKHNVIVEYKLEHKSGPPHMPILSYACEINGDVFGRGTGNNKQTAKLNAAKLAYEKLIGQSDSRMERNGAHTNASTNSSVCDSQRVSEEINVKSVEEAVGAPSSVSDSIVFQDSNATANRLADQVNGLHLNESSSSLVSPKGPAVKPKRKETPLAPKFSKPVQKASKYTVNERFLEDFHDIEKLGCGGYGNVFKARHIIDDKIYAIKRVRLTAEKTEKIKKEAQALVRLLHENIVQYFDSWIGRDMFSFDDSMSNDSCQQAKFYCLFIRMDYCEKGTLANWIRQERRKASSNDEVLMKFHQIVNGVEFIHRNNFIHRDLKPLNIFISKDDKIKIGDFGLVTTGVDDLSAERTQEKGTRLYMAPEQARNNYGKEVDIFALGLILFEMLYAFETDHERHKTLWNVREGDFPKEFCERFPREMKLIKKLIAKEPSERPPANSILKFLDNQPHNTHTF
uniref:Interferon-induced, double-stranded RNA-activated protein kinase isoform X1 n=1 Tax=Pogona vitticeps TaxID=103695 RepID=A0A6J0UCL9_9SAUR